MKVTLESTDRVIVVVTPEGDVPARVWCGATDSGTPVFAFITRIAPEITLDDPRHGEFERELMECRAPSAAVEAWLRYWQSRVIL